MLHSLYRAGLFAALFGLLLVPGTAWAQKEGRPRHVHDEAKLFSKEAIVQVNLTIDKIKKTHGKDLYIDTVESGEKDKDARTKWAKTRFNDFGIDGMYIVVSKDPSFYRFYVGDSTREKGYFTKANIDKMDENLKQITKTGKRDDALIEAANYVLESMNEHARAKGNAPQPKAQPAPVKQAEPKPKPVANQDAAEIPSWVGWACLIIGVLVVVWIVFAIIRSLTSMGGGYGGGGYGGGGGMGMGGGLLTGMLGGMFGAMAGMWLYNNMFGGHASYGPNGNVNWGGDQGGGSGYQGDTGNDAGGGGEGDGGGGGAEGAGGDEKEAGGDWGKGRDDDAGGGGGGDAGGGGDWGGGGGGGDFGGGGGGGGGDW